MKGILVFIWEITKIVIIALLIVVPIRTFLFQPFFVRGESMSPAFENGDYLIVDQLSYRFRDPQRGEVIVFKHSPSQRYIKRIIGLPGETVEIKDGKVMIYNREEIHILDELDYLPPDIFTTGEDLTVLTEDQYFVLGDNRYASADSRRWGSLTREDIIGRVFFRAWPFTAFAKIEAPAY